MVVDQITHTRKYLICELDPAIALQDLNDRPDLWRLVLQDRAKAPAPNDHIELRSADWTAFAVVSEIDAGKVYLYDIRRASRPKRTVALYEDDQYRVEMRGARYAVYRKRDNSPNPFGGMTYETVDQARAFIRQQYPVKLGA